MEHIRGVSIRMQMNVGVTLANVRIGMSAIVALLAAVYKLQESVTFLLLFCIAHWRDGSVFRFLDFYLKLKQLMKPHKFSQAVQSLKTYLTDEFSHK